MQKQLSLTLVVLFSCITFNAYADIIGKNGCEDFGVQIYNKTDSECLFQNYRVQKGYLISITPNITVIPANSTQTFVVQQNLVQGPTITIDYLCNGHKVTLESHQNYCYLTSGSIRGDIISIDPGLGATYVTTEGSHYWSYPGHIYWALEDKNN